ncbi:protein kinase [Arthrobacter sp. B0490]|uniref:protein kinase domain-containing protein n=1 Tax=Arthrobacter sp. B0490 TaxID=2058891 RepID=UPI0015E45C48|nr:protein kinase [Arthrobacter sp. B0490]
MSDLTRSRHAGGTRAGPPHGEELLAPGNEPVTADPADPGEDADRPSVAGLRVGRLLGRGGSSTVWLVTDDAGRSFALKVARQHPSGEAIPPPPTAVEGRHGRRAARGIPTPPVGRPGPGPSGDAAGPRHPARQPGGPEDGLQGAVQELRLLQGSAHEHLVRVHRLVETDRGPGLLMDLAKGGSLLGLVTSRGPLPVPEVVTALAPVAQVLDHLHGAGALHGDVAPANILFTHEGKPLLGDLGTGRLLGSEPGAAVGTPGFLDPGWRGDFDAGADMFALAAVAWFALTGRVPGPTEQRPPLSLIVPEVPPQLVQLIEDGLGADRDRRPTADRFARTLLASAVPAPISLASAVHASVLPELLTRRADAPAVRPSRWEQVIRRAGARWSRSGSATSSAPRDTSAASTTRPSRASRPSPSGRAGSAGRVRARGHRRRSAHRMRGLPAIVAGLAAAVLLVAGILLTLGSPGAPTAATGGPAPTGQEEAGGPEELPPAAQGGPARGRDDWGPSREPDAPEGQGASAASDASPDASLDAPRDASDEASPDDSAVDDPLTALAGLAGRRATAFATADPAILEGVDVEGSPAMAADREAVGALAGSGRVFRDLSIGIRDPVVLTGSDLAALPAVASLPAVATPTAAEVSVVRATAVLSSYTSSSASSSRAGPQPEAAPGPLMAAGRQELIFVLWRTDPGWRIHSVVSPPG